MIKKITFKPVSIKNRLIRNLDALECKKRIVAPVMEIGMPAFDKRRRRVLHQIGHTWVWHRFCCAEGGLLGPQLSLENVLDKIVVVLVVAGFYARMSSSSWLNRPNVQEASLSQQVAYLLSLYTVTLHPTKELMGEFLTEKKSLTLKWRWIRRWPKQPNPTYLTFTHWALEY